MENLLYFIHEQDRREQIQNVRIRHRHLRDTTNAFELPDHAFLKLFRLSKEAVLYLIENLSPHLPNGQRSTFIPKNIKILASFSFFGRGSYQLDVAQNYLFGLSQPSMSRCINQVVTAINNHLLNEWIEFPTTPQKKNVVKDGFLENHNFPGVIGTVDCTHIAIKAPPADDPEFPARVYFNRKKYASINTQVICDSQLKILNINARYPGSTNDSAIWATSNIRDHLRNAFLNGDESTYLLGDSGYPLEPWLLTPIVDAIEGTPEAAFTRAHIRTRNCIERFNGAFKSRFRCCLRHRCLNYSPVKVAKIIYACAVLHNISIHFRNNIPDDGEVVDEQFQVEQHVENNDWLNEGRRILNNVIHNFFNM